MGGSRRVNWEEEGGRHSAVAVLAAEAGSCPDEDIDSRHSEDPESSAYCL
jgi:hypothetical protein